MLLRTYMTNLLLLCLICFIHSHILCVPYVSFRSQSEDAARELVGLTQHINLPVKHFYGTFAYTPQYTRSFAQNRIADCLFGEDLRSTTLSALDITGSGVADRNACKQWLADYFGLPRDFNSTVRFEPTVSNSMIDFYWYLGLHNLLYGLYVTIHAPIVATHWSLHYAEVVNKEGIADQPPGYFNQVATGDNVGVRRTDLLKDFTDFVFKEQTPCLGDQVTFLPLKVAKMVPEDFSCHKTKIALSDIQAVVGWNFLLNRWYHLGIGIRGVAPTGNAPTSEFVFEPIVGNGHHWELGGQLWGHYTFYVSENEERQWMVYFLSNITHLFNARQSRVFDLVDKQNSRWMLAQKMTSNVSSLQAALLPDDIDPDNLHTPNAQFDNLFVPLANLTQRNIKVSSTMQLDAVLMFSYINSKKVTIDFGYNVWYRSCEKIRTIPCHTTPFEQQLWSLKGDSYVFGFTSDVNPLIASNIPVALSATQSQATIHAGTNNFVDLDGDRGGIDNMRPTRNPGVDNRFFAAATFSGNTTTLNDRTVDGDQTNTSYNPICIQEHDLDICSAQTKGFSTKLFLHISHSWFDYPREDRIPYIGGGLEMEFGKTVIEGNGCQQCALSQWGIWIKGGVSFS